MVSYWETYRILCKQTTVSLGEPSHHQSHSSFNLGKITFENPVSNAKIRPAAKHRATTAKMSLVSGGGHYNLFPRWQDRLHV